MTLPPLEQLVERFLAFTRDFLDETGPDLANIRLKIDHSLRVLDMAREITAQESITGPARDLALAAALLHDTGRFPQYARYRTFSDRDSENHAVLGVRTLHQGLGNGAEEGLLAGFSRRAAGIVLGAVRLHNLLALGDGLKEPLSTVARVVRDSDKLDILPVLKGHLTGQGPDNKVVTLGVAPHPTAYSQAMLDTVLARQNADYRSMRHTNDFKLLAISWVYGLEFPATARLMREQGHLDGLLDSLPQDRNMDRLRLQIRDDLDKLCRSVHV